MTCVMINDRIINEPEPTRFPLCVSVIIERNIPIIMLYS